MHYVLFSGTLNPPSTHPLSASLSESLYLRLLPRLQQSAGFISQVPFASPTDPNGQLLYAVFEDEEAVMRWRTEGMHLGVQRTGRERVFGEYRIRVGVGLEREGEGPVEVEGVEGKGDGGSGEVKAQEGDGRKEQVMLAYQRPTPPAPLAASGSESQSESAPASAPAPVMANLKSLLEPSKAERVVWDELNDESTWLSETTVLWMTSWKSLAAAKGFEKAISRVDGDSVQMVRVLRDYGKDDRREVPGNENESVKAVGDEEGGE